MRNGAYLVKRAISGISRINSLSSSFEFIPRGCIVILEHSWMDNYVLRTLIICSNPLRIFVADFVGDEITNFLSPIE
jgi:hypothetical protein